MASPRRASATRPETSDPLTLHVAVVHAPDAVRLVTAAPSRAALAARLADYVRQQAEDQLWPDDARRLHQLLANGQLDAAIEQYFAAVGERWDEERLFVDVIELGAASA